MANDFEEMGLDSKIIKAIDYFEYETPTMIQLKAIPLLLEGRDVIGQAKTGTGKTAAFVLPMLHRFDPKIRDIQILVVTPTRELAIQVAKVIRDFASYLRLRVLTIYGGQSYGKQIRRLQRGVDIVVGTPGRLRDLIEQNLLHLGSVRYVVLDEADEMLSMGFIEDVKAIVDKTSSNRQMALFSATLPERICHLASRYMRDPETIIVASPRRTVTETKQRYYRVDPGEKFAVLLRVLDLEPVRKALVFARTKIKVAELAEDLRAAGVRAEALHGDMNQRARERAMAYFRDEPTHVLVATDVAARGLDVLDISHVINYDIPLDPKMYLHRIGRTGRAGRGGVAISLVIPDEINRLKDIEVYTLDPIAVCDVPAIDDVIEHRSAKLAEAIGCDCEHLEPVTKIISRLSDEGRSSRDIAISAVSLLWEGQRPDLALLNSASSRGITRRSTVERDRSERKPSRGRMVTLVMTVGSDQDIRPADVVRTFTEKAGIQGRDIGLIAIESKQTYIDVNKQRVDQVLQALPYVRIRGYKARLYPADSSH